MNVAKYCGDSINRVREGERSDLIRTSTNKNSRRLETPAAMAMFRLRTTSFMSHGRLTGKVFTREIVSGKKGDLVKRD